MTEKTLPALPVLLPFWAERRGAAGTAPPAGIWRISAPYYINEFLQKEKGDGERCY